MQSQARLEEYRRMTPGQRLLLTFELIEEGWPYLYVGTEEQVNRKFQLMREQKDLANRRLLDAFAKSRKAVD